MVAISNERDCHSHESHQHPTGQMSAMLFLQLEQCCQGRRFSSFRFPFSVISLSLTQFPPKIQLGTLNSAESGQMLSVGRR